MQKTYFSVRITRCDREHRAKRIVQHRQKKSITFHHLMVENNPRQTIYSIIQKYDACGIVGDSSRSGRRKEISIDQRTHMKRLVNHQTGISLRKIDQKFNVHRRTFQRVLKDMSMHYRKKKRAPNYTEKQIEEVPNRARRLYRTLLEDDYRRRKVFDIN